MQALSIQQLGGIPLIAAGRLEGPWQQAIHTYKYLPRPRLAPLLSAHLAARVRAAAIPIEALTFVPLHPARQRERGFNQAEKVAHALALGMGLPLIQGLARLRHTRAQVGLTEVVRRQNVDGAFGWRAGVAPPAGLALVDDVCTTGATLEAAAEAIAEAGGQISAFLVLGSPLRQPGYGLLRASGRPQTLPAPVVTSPE